MLDYEQIDRMAHVISDWMNDITVPTDVPVMAICYCMEALTKLLKEQKAKIERLSTPDCEHANHDGAGCLGYCGCEQDDEPIEACKQCEKYTGNICIEY